MPEDVSCFSSRETARRSEILQAQLLALGNLIGETAPIEPDFEDLDTPEKEIPSLSKKSLGILQFGKDRRK